MKWNAKDRIEHHTCPAALARLLTAAGEKNRYGQPNFRVVWGYDRLVKIFGRWEEWEPARPTGLVGADGRPIVIPPHLKSFVIEPREVPKYLPGNCWHLEKYSPPEEYGDREKWAEIGKEVYGSYTLDCSGEYPEHGDYELVFPLTSDGTPGGTPLLIAEAADAIVDYAYMARFSNRFSLAQRRAAIQQRMERQDRLATARMESVLRDGLPAFGGNSFVTR